jgi:metal-responsive CopG/Arc/MetJ family transcriptional regulator
MSKQSDHRVPVGVSLPQSIVDQIDEERGLVPRSAYIVMLLEKVLPTRRKSKNA